MNLGQLWRTRWQARAIGLALTGALIGALVGMIVPIPRHYEAQARVALMPSSRLSIADSSNYWEVLSRGQITNTAAEVYADRRWLDGAAVAARVNPEELSLGAGAVPDTTLILLTLDAPTEASARAALSDVLLNANREVAALSAPFLVRMVTTPDADTVAVGAARIQVVALAAFIGLLLGAGGWVLSARLESRRTAAGAGSAGAEVESIPVP